MHWQSTAVIAIQVMKLCVQCILAGATPHLLANKLQREMTSEGIFPAVKESSGAVGSLKLKDELNKVGELHLCCCASILNPEVNTFFLFASTRLVKKSP